MKLNLIFSTSFSILFSFSPLAQQGFTGISTLQYNNVHALIVGVSDYKEINDLNYAEDDAILMGEIVETLFPEADTIAVLTNEDATGFKIQKGLYSISKNIQEGDLFIFYFSGLGDAVSNVIDGEESYLLSHDAPVSREYALGGAVSFSFINKVLQKFTEKGAEVWMITDACCSGKVINQNGAAATMAMLNTGFNYTTKFVSCMAHELSLEDDTLKHGVFTYFLAKALLGAADTDDVPGELTADEIDHYLKQNVRKHTDSKQTPRVYTSNEFKSIISINEEMTKKLESLEEENDTRIEINSSK